MNLSQHDSTISTARADDPESRGAIHELETPALTLPELIVWVEARLVDEEQPAHVQRTWRTSEIDIQEAA